VSAGQERDAGHFDVEHSTVHFEPASQAALEHLAHA
jgi:hypothetical protein